MISQLNFKPQLLWSFNYSTLQEAHVDFVKDAVFIGCVKNFGKYFSPCITTPEI